MPADKHHLLPSCVFYKFKNESVTKAASKGMHTKPRNLYRPIKVKQKVRILGSATTATHGGLPCTALVYGGPLYTDLIHGPHARPSCTALFCTAVLHGQIVKPPHTHTLSPSTSAECRVSARQIIPQLLLVLEG